MSRMLWRWPIVLVVTLVSCGFYGLIWSGLLADPQLHGIDFISFYTAGRIAQALPLSQLYDLDQQRAVQVPIIGPDFVQGGLLPFMHPPFLAPLFGLIVSDDYRASYMRWALLLTILVAAAALAVAARFRRGGAGRGAAAMVALGALIFYPSFIGVLKGQDTALIALGVAGCFYALATGQPLAAGLALGLTVIKPQLALSLGLPLMLTNRRAGLGFLISAGGLGLLSVALVGAGGVRGYLELIMLSNTGVGYGLNQEAMFNVVGLTLRAVPTIDRALLSAVKWGAYLAGTGAVCWLWWSRRDRIGDRELGAAIVVALFVSPHLHFHDLSLALIPVAALALAWHRAGGRWAVAAPLLPALASAALLIASLLPNDMSYGATYLLQGSLLAALLAGGRPNPPPASPENHAVPPRTAG
ncbi:MAG: glycosyltransferase family 87 protein [Chloroflexales bacterium]